MTKFNLLIHIFRVTLVLLIFVKSPVAQETNTNKAIEALLEQADSLGGKGLKYAQEALKMAEKQEQKYLEGRALLQIGGAMQAKGQYQKAQSYFDSATTIFREKNANKYISRTLYKSGSNYIYLGNFDKAKELFSRGLTFAKLLKDSSAMGSYLQNISITHLKRGDYSPALSYNQRALKIVNQIGDSLGIAYCTRHMGNIYKNLNKPNKAIAYYEEAMERFQALNFDRGISLSANSIGKIYKEQGSYETANEYFKKSFSIANPNGLQSGISENIKDIGHIYFLQENYSKAEAYYKRALQLEQEMGAVYKIAKLKLKMGQLYNATEQYAKANKNLKKARELFSQTEAHDYRAKIYKALAKSEANLGNHAGAYDLLRRYQSLHDSIFNNKQQRRIATIEETYKQKKNEQRIKLQDSKITSKNTKLEQQRIKSNALIASIIVMLALIGFITYIYIQKRNANAAITKQNKAIKIKNAQLVTKNEEITAQRDEIIKQRDEIMQQKEEIEKQKDEIDRHRNTLMWQTKEITDSILYARYIQQAMLPSEEIFNNALKDYFLFYKPRDIVSGDFYWAKKVNNFTYIAAVDCSGHGVPGAFMSMLGFAFLNEIVNYKNPVTASTALDELRDTVKEALGQTEAKEGTREGMSMSLCVINHDEQVMHFAGAFNPLYQFRNGDLIRHSANRQPVAIYFNEKPFTQKTIPYQEGDTFYIFTDGYSDQFGGKEGKKYKKKPFQQLLLQIHQESMDTQMEVLNRNLQKWMGSKHDQVDDILVMGFRII